MATNYYKNTTSNDNSTATDIESLYATARVSIADANMKEKYYDSSTLTDIATKFAIPPSGSNFDKMTPPDTYYRNSTSYSPLILVKKGCAPHIETDLQRSGATTKVIDGPGHFHNYTVDRRSSSGYRIYDQYTSDSEKRNKIFSSDVCVAEDFYLGEKSGFYGISKPDTSDVDVPSGVSAPIKFFFQCCAGGGGGGGSSMSYASGGGGAGASICGVADVTETGSISWTLGYWGYGGSKGDKNNCGNGGDGDYATLISRSATEMTSGNVYYYFFKSITMKGGKGGGAGRNPGGTGGAGAGNPTYNFGLVRYWNTAIINGNTGQVIAVTSSLEVLTYPSIAPTISMNQWLKPSSVFDINVEQGLYSGADYSVYPYLYEQDDIFITDYFSGASGGAYNGNAGNRNPLTATFTPDIIFAASNSAFAGGGSRGGGASGMGIGSVHGGADAGPGGGGNGRPTAGNIFDPGQAGFHGGNAQLQLYFY